LQIKCEEFGNAAAESMLVHLKPRKCCINGEDKIYKGGEEIYKSGEESTPFIDVLQNSWIMDLKHNGISVSLTLTISEVIR
jgi:hypothetical protein